jgi:hypothetical protein
MRDEEILDELIAVVDLISQSPATPPNPNIGTINIKLAKIKASRVISKKKFFDHFGNLSKIVKQISDIDL